MNRHVFINANLVDGLHPARPASIIVEGKRIAAVLPAGAPLPQAEGQVHNLGGRTLMPGMVAGHFHAAFHNLGAESGIPTLENPPAFTAYRALANAQLALRCGFTGVVSAGCAYDIDASLQRAIDSGVVEGPRFVPCSPDTLSSTDGIIPWWLNMNVRGGVENCDGPDELRKAVRRNVNRGARMFKMSVSGGHGVLVPKGCRIFTFEEMCAAVEAAHDLGIRVRAHVAGKPFILDCIRAGVDILDHCDDMDEECIEAMVKSNVLVLPSLYQTSKILEMPAMFGFAVEETRKEFEWMCSILPKAVAAGVNLCIGDDFGTGLSPHGEYGKELAIYTRHAGISPLEVIRWATVNGARMLGRGDELGLIAAGRIADLIIVDGDPTQDIAVLGDRENIVAVMRDGAFASFVNLPLLKATQRQPVSAAAE